MKSMAPNASDASSTPIGGPVPLSQTVLECGSGEPIRRETGACEEVLFVLSGTGTVRLDGRAHSLEPESGAYFAPGESYELSSESEEPLRAIVVSIPDPAPETTATGRRAVVRRLADQDAQDATGAREFRIVADPGSGLRSATHFVGYIPVGRAPDHFHTYDEVIYVLEGEGAFHGAEGSHPVACGSTIRLPARQIHSLENSGADVMRVVAVFRPAGSPAAAYYPDGTAAHPSAPPVDGPPAYPVSPNPQVSQSEEDTAS